MEQEDKLGIPPEWDILEDSMEATHVATSGNYVYAFHGIRKQETGRCSLQGVLMEGDTFGETINVSNSTDTRSDGGHVYALGDNMYMTRWETSKNVTSVPVFRASNDDGESLGPILRLPANGTIDEE